MSQVSGLALEAPGVHLRTCLVFETHFLGVFVVDFFEGVNDVKDLVLGVAKLFERAERTGASSLLRCGYLLRSQHLYNGVRGSVLKCTDGSLVTNCVSPYAMV